MKITDKAQTWEEHLEMINILEVDEDPPTGQDHITEEGYGDLDHIWYPGEDTEDYELGYDNAVRELDNAFEKLQVSQNSSGIVRMIAQGFAMEGNQSMRNFMQKISNYLYVNGY